MIVVVANLKGGVGKTTSSMYLAHALSQATGDQCALIDSDPQGSATQWAKSAAVLLTRTRRTRSVAEAEGSLRTLGVHVLSTHVPLREAVAMGFGQRVRQLHGYDLVVAELLGALPVQPYSVEAVRQRVESAAA